jgi:hypothetical protein
VPIKDRVSLNHKPLQTITKIKFDFPLSNPHKEEDNTNFLGLTTTLVAPKGHLVRLGDESPRVTNTQRLLVKCSCLKIEQVTQDLTQISHRRLEFDWSMRECLSSRNLGWKVFQINRVAKWVKGQETPFYSPHSESSRWGVRQPDMSSWELDKSRNPLCNPVLSRTSPVHQDLVE